MLLLIDKPQGRTSFDVIRKLKRLYPGEKIGHAGTLDPMATGLLIVALGNDTKQLHTFLQYDKTYETTIDFSKDSDTRDLDYRSDFKEYERTQEFLHKDGNNVPIPSYETMQKTVLSMVGTHPFPLTPFSAKKIKGKKLYEYARAGTPIFMDIPMTVHAVEILEYAFPLLRLNINVGSGTYIRSLGHRIGQQLGLWWILVQLRRTSIDRFSL